MTWQQKDEFGRGGNDMFEDPLNIRAGSQRSQRPQAAAPAPRAAREQQREDSYRDHPDLTVEEHEEESWNPVSGFLMWMVAGGQQCCSMRDRTNPQQEEAAKRASETGRPPSKFADAGPRSEAPRDRGVDSFNPPRRDQASPQAAQDSSRSLGQERRGRDAESDQEPRRRDQQQREQKEQREREQQKQREQQSASAAPPGMPRALPQRWEWPTWCLDFKNPSIEVWVMDDDTGSGRWVEGEPQSRVVDKSGRDAYLCAEYEWEGEYYAQDFGPQHVRRRGWQETVIQLLDRQQGGGTTDLDATRIAPGRRK